ncbi:MAG: TetR/AcrR family transcriptional regulator [Verrucomicrobiota bacterium]
MKTRPEIIAAYIEHLLEHGRPPLTVHRFCRENDIEERAFFSEFASFNALESAFWEELLTRVIAALESGAEWESFSARQRLLSFHFAFAEESLNYRSLLLSRVAPLKTLARPDYLRGLQSRFKTFARRLIEHGLAGREIAGRGMVGSLYPEAFYVHFRSVIEFHLKDESARFERTDAFIEKSVGLLFDLLRPQALDSAVDLARFLFAQRHGKAA